MNGDEQVRPERIRSRGALFERYEFKTWRRELQVPAWLTAPEPNTWRDLLATIDAAGADIVKGARVAVQEYGTSNVELLAELTSRGAIVTRVPVYQWALPEDLEPLRDGIRTFLWGSQLTLVDQVQAAGGSGDQVDVIDFGVVGGVVDAEETGYAGRDGFVDGHGLAPVGRGRCKHLPRQRDGRPAARPPHQGER